MEYKQALSDCCLSSSESSHSFLQVQQQHRLLKRLAGAPPFSARRPTSLSRAPARRELAASPCLAHPDSLQAARQAQAARTRA